MGTLPSLFRRLYGERVLHLIVLVAALALAVYTVTVLGVKSLYNPDVWWQSIGVWFAVAVIGHDLILFPLYALAERLLGTPRPPQRRRPTGAQQSDRLSLTNYLRMPTLASGLLFLMFFPGIIEQGGPAYQAATGETQAPFLHRWLLLVAAFYLTSAIWYVTKTLLRQRFSASSAPSPTLQQSTVRDHAAEP